MRVLLVVDPTRDTFVADIAFAAMAALQGVGHRVDLVDLAAEQFPAVMTAEDRRAYFTPNPLVCPQAAASAEFVRGAEALVFVYPTTLSTVTPLVKGWIERTFVPGVAFTIGDRNGAKRGMSNVRRLVGVATYDESHRSVLRHGDNGRRLIQRNVRLCGGVRTRSSWIPFYGAATAGADRRTTFLGTVQHRMARL